MENIFAFNWFALSICCIANLATWQSAFETNSKYITYFFISVIELLLIDINALLLGISSRTKIQGQNLRVLGHGPAYILFFYFH
jgi:hypothetical protein